MSIEMRNEIERLKQRVQFMEDAFAVVLENMAQQQKERSTLKLPEKKKRAEAN